MLRWLWRRRKRCHRSAAAHTAIHPLHSWRHSLQPRPRMRHRVRTAVAEKQHRQKKKLIYAFLWEHLCVCEPECVNARTLDDRDDVILIRVDFCYPGCAVVRRQPCGVDDQIRQWRKRGVVPVASCGHTFPRRARSASGPLFFHSQFSRCVWALSLAARPHASPSSISLI